jgi:radical SAM superfamily enzyme YgiQ (UPF0313 family)
MHKEKILLVLLPFWDPQIPPSGISCLKQFLRQRGYTVKTVDANVDIHLKEAYHNYFDTLRRYIPESRIGNYFKIGYDVLRNHMMAFLHRGNEEDYIELARALVRIIFYADIDRVGVIALHDIISKFYGRLEHYFLRLLEEEQPSVLGISVYSDTLPASLFAFKLTKEKFPAIRTVMGGGVFANELAVGTPNMDEFLQRVPYIDKILVGEGELLFLEYLEGRLPDSQKLATLRDIDNEILDLSTVKAPDFSDFDLGFYPHLTTYASRSCPFQCQFCTETLQWGRFRKKSAQQVVNEMVSLYREHGTQIFLMSDSLLNPVASALSAEMEKQDLSLYWDGYLRADKHVGDTETALAWRRGGFYRARLGIESGSQRVLELMNKRITPEQIKAAISSLAHAGIKTTTYWVVGYPGESEADFQETLDLLEEMVDDIYEADCTPFWYFMSAQVGDEQWKDKRLLLYPEKSEEMLILRRWFIDCEPDRQEIYRRMYRFVAHCKRLGIPNPYSLHDFHKADLRWLELHKNAVPPLVRFEDENNYVNENRYIKHLLSAQTYAHDDGDFGF